MNMLTTLSFAENVGRNGRHDSLQSLDLKDFTSFCDFIRASQSCRQGVDRPPSLALRRLVWVDQAECVVASLFLADFCVLGTSQPCNGPSLVHRFVQLFAFLHKFVSSWLSQQRERALEQKPNALVQSLCCLWKPHLASPGHFCYLQRVSPFSG